MRRSRGLGDVYKRQALLALPPLVIIHARPRGLAVRDLFLVLLLLVLLWRAHCNGRLR
jgi:hypothetical protein